MTSTRRNFLRGVCGLLPLAPFVVLSDPEPPRFLYRCEVRLREGWDMLLDKEGDEWVGLQDANLDRLHERVVAYFARLGLGLCRSMRVRVARYDEGFTGWGSDSAHVIYRFAPDGRPLS